MPLKYGLERVSTVWQMRIVREATLGSYLLVLVSLALLGALDGEDSKVINLTCVNFQLSNLDPDNDLKLCKQPLSKEIPDWN